MSAALRYEGRWVVPLGAEVAPPGPIHAALLSAIRERAHAMKARWLRYMELAKDDHFLTQHHSTDFASVVALAGLVFTAEFARRKLSGLAQVACDVEYWHWIVDGCMWTQFEMHQRWDDATQEAAKREGRYGA